MLDGISSMSPIATHRQTIGLADVSQRYLTRFFQNSAQPKGALKGPTSLSDEAVRKLREAWERRHQGAENSGRIAIFDGGMEWQEIGMSMEDAQYVELQQMSIEDIARIYGVPAHKINDLRRATFSNIEHQAIAFYQDTILKWCRRIESRMNPYLLTPKERKQGYFIAFDMKGILRGDAAARSQLYNTLFYLGAMSPNEIRRAEDMNPHQDGDRYFVQGAAMPLDKIDETLAARTPAPQDPVSDNEQDQPEGETPPSP
jgi:HK97 family phage portal protein